MLNVSKWIKIPLLIDLEEMRALFASLPAFTIYQIQKVTLLGEGVIPIDLFLADYACYISALKQGKIPSSLTSPVFSVSSEAMEVVFLDGKRQLYRPRLPVVQVVAHAIRYSTIDQSIRSQLFGVDGITWGIQVGYPQIFEDPKTHEIQATRHLVNGPLFYAMQKWIRLHTRPTPFIIAGCKQNVPIRLGKQCFSWINSHSQLEEKGIKIDDTLVTSTLYSQ
ncbi:MAG: hypothetical protein R3E91_02315 [Chlamydiales bacterium]